MWYPGLKSLHSPRIDWLTWRNVESEGSKLNDRSQTRSGVAWTTHDASINSPHTFDSREVQASVRLERDVGFQFSILAIQPFEIRVPLDANKP